MQASAAGTQLDFESHAHAFSHEDLHKREFPLLCGSYFGDPNAPQCLASVKSGNQVAKEKYW